MSEQLTRKFNVGEIVYVIDEEKNTLKPTEATIIVARRRTFDAIIHGDTYMRYSCKDFGRLVFDAYEEAEEEINKFPKINSKVYIIKNEKYVLEYILKDIRVLSMGKMKITNLSLFLQNPYEWLDSKTISISEIGKNAFLLKEYK